MGFADHFTLKLGDQTVKGERLTIKEIRENWTSMMEGRLDLAAAIPLIKKHVKLENGAPLDPEDLSLDQLRKLIAELTLPEEGRGIADFIGLLC